jgi:LAO/AO transport system kinase
MTSELLWSRVLAGEPRAIARAISLVENGSSSSAELLARLADLPGRAFVVGVTGPPGAGKSTLVDRLTATWRQAGHRVGILAVDPSSPYSGGAILGDRVRMQAHAGDAGVFIRSMAARGHTGGLAGTTADAVGVLAAAGFDPIVVETVGVGQAEVEIVRVADVTVVVLVPGSGDDIQALKAGLMEVGDLFVVNKADRDGADRAIASIEAMLTLDERPDRPWRPQVLTSVATTGQGVDELAAALAEFRREASALIDSRRLARRAPPSWTGETMQIDHVGIAVDAPDAVLGFLEGVLGFRAGLAEEVASSGVRVRFLGAADARLEVIEPVGTDSPISRFLARRGPGLHHVAVRVGNLPEALARLRTRGIRLIDETPRAGAHGARIAFVHPSSTGGVLVELVERPGA